VVVDSFKFLPRSFRPWYEGRGPFPGETDPVWAPFAKRLADARVALLTSAGMYVEGAQAPFDLEGERARPEWGDPSWRAIPSADRGRLGVAHLHVNDEDIVADPEIALPAASLERLVEERVVGATVAEHVSVMGFQERNLRDWRATTAPEIVAHLRQQGADGLVLAPA
jgi:Glycine/sarcosine/betaine reductase selenoprotein B (GRDB)